MKKKEWWRDFFSGLTVDMWQRVVSEEQNRQEADFIQRVLGLAPPSRLLDVPCGGGRLSLELARRGFQLTGIDYSKEFLKVARSISAERGLAIAWERRDMRDLPWRKKFEGVFCFGNSFGYLDDKGNADFLKSALTVLKPGGTFVLDASSVVLAVIPTPPFTKASEWRHGYHIITALTEL